MDREADTLRRRVRNDVIRVFVILALVFTASLWMQHNIVKKVPVKITVLLIDERTWMIWRRPRRRHPRGCKHPWPSDYDPRSYVDQRFYLSITSTNSDSRDF
jgi:hypothetical protein